VLQVLPRRIDLGGAVQLQLRLQSTSARSQTLAIDYAVVRDATTLLPVSSFERPTRALIAARLDTVRLIDNMAMPVCR
jgi:pantothenate synthetase